MSDTTEDELFEDPKSRAPGRRINTDPSSSARAHALDPDINAWDKQPSETPDAYAAFVAYRDSEARMVGKHGYWSCVWSWGYRTHEWDKFMAAVDVKEMVRYRRTMNERHRTIARVALNKAAQWLQAQRTETMKLNDVVRLLEVGVRVERAASGADPLLEAAMNRSDNEDAPIGDGDTFADVLGDAGLSEAEMARAVHAMLSAAVRAEVPPIP